MRRRRPTSGDAGRGRARAVRPAGSRADEESDGTLAGVVGPGRAVARRVTERLWAVARDPLRVLPVVAVIALLAIAVPLTVTGLRASARGAMDWRHQSTIDWRRTTATSTG